MKPANRLIRENSPYLLQHAYNPVAWYPWGREAFEKAKKENRPVFLSIGYSSCHWCHVMAHESFEDEDVAAIMNDAFVCVKVDREELPHIDHIFMRVCQMMTGSGGWPMTIIMTPDKEPFYAATYLPKHARGGLIGMMELVPLIKDSWDKDRRAVDELARAVSAGAKAQAHIATAGNPGEKWLADTYEALSRSFQDDTGGFSPAPKFPTPHHIMFLLRFYQRTGEGHALHMAERTLFAMRSGGIYDHAGFGFHRYATDTLWRIPHFEKMLYDQALLAMAYTEAYLVTSKELYRNTAREVLDYALTDLRSEEGIFISSQDADTNGEEGGYYVWTSEELRSFLEADDYRLFTRVFPVEDRGNYPEGLRSGKNILFMRDPLPQTAQSIGMSGEDLHHHITRILKIILDKRAARTPPPKDDKALTDWNGLMIAALAKAGAAFKEPRYTEAARRAAGFILSNVKDGSGRLLHLYREGSSAHHALLNDYTFLVWGLIELYEASFEQIHLDEALRLTRECIDKFRDQENGAFFLTPNDAEVVITRPKEWMDSALPSGNGVALYNLMRLARITGDVSLENLGMEIPRTFSGMITAIPGAQTFLMAGLDYALGPSIEIVIAGDPCAEDTKVMLDIVTTRFLPNGVVVLAPEDSRKGERLPITKDKKSLEGKATAYICNGFTCSLPITDTDELIKALSQHTGLIKNPSNATTQDRF